MTDHTTRDAKNASEGELLRDEIARIIAATDGWHPGIEEWRRDPPQGFYEAADALIAAGLVVPAASDAKNENPADVAAFLFGLVKSTSSDVRDLPLLAELNAYLDRVELRETP